MKLASSRRLMNVAQSRVGRRPISVQNMLKRDKEGTLFKQSKAITKTSTAVPDQSTFYFKDDSPEVTERPTRSNRKPGDVPDRDVPSPAMLMSPTQKLAGLKASFRDAFLDELQHIAVANQGIGPWPGEFEKFASSALVEETVKEAFIGYAARAIGRLRPAARSTVSPSIPPPSAFRKGQGGFGIAQGLSQGGAMLKGPKRVAGLNAEDMATVRQIRPTSATRRVVGEAARSSGQHMAHSHGLRKALNPLGVPIGGALEGATKQVGRELQRAGGAVRTGIKGQQTLGGGIRGQVGRAMERHAGKAGLAGEIGTLGTIGAALHAPLNSAAILGGKLAPGLGHAGALGHIGQDAVGTLAQQAVKVLPKLPSIIPVAL